MLESWIGYRHTIVTLAGQWWDLDMKERDKEEVRNALSDNAKVSLTAVGAALAGIIIGSAALVGNWVLQRLFEIFG